MSREIKKGSPVWHIITGPECTGIVLESGTGGRAKVHWIGSCGYINCCVDTEQWILISNLRLVGEDE